MDRGPSASFRLRPSGAGTGTHARPVSSEAAPEAPANRLTSRRASAVFGQVSVHVRGAGLPAAKGGGLLRRLCRGISVWKMVILTGLWDEMPRKAGLDHGAVSVHFEQGGNISLAIGRGRKTQKLRPLSRPNSMSCRDGPCVRVTTQKEVASFLTTCASFNERLTPMGRPQGVHSSSWRLRRAIAGSIHAG